MSPPRISRAAGKSSAKTRTSWGPPCGMPSDAPAPKFVRRMALDAGATQDRAEQLGLGLATGDLDYDPVVHLELPEREHVRLGAGLEERDLQRPLADPVVLAHELIQAAVAEQAVPVVVDVHAV